MKVLFSGVGFFPWLTSGEKNFFLKLLPLLKEKIDVSVFSLNDSPDQELIYKTLSGDIPVYCAKRPFHRNHERFFFQKEGYIAYHHRHKPHWENIEKFASIMFHLPRLRHIINHHNIGIIHFMDNFGPAMPFLKTIFPKVSVTYSAANYDPRGRQSIYDAYLKMSIGYLDATGVYTKAYLQKLREIGVAAPLKLTPWGVSVMNQPLDPVRKIEIRQQLGVGVGQRLLLWSGYLQQIQEVDYLKAVKVAREVVRARPDITFLFAFKPETFKPVYAQEAGERIKVVTGIKNFGDVVEVADLFYSPIGSSLSTVSPPLTWLEAMSKGTPVITTAVGGVEEVITHGETGYVASGYSDLAEIVMGIPDDDSLSIVSKRAQDHVAERFNIQRSADAYLELWREV